MPLFCAASAARNRGDADAPARAPSDLAHNPVQVQGGRVTQTDEPVRGLGAPKDKPDESEGSTGDAGDKPVKKHKRPYKINQEARRNGRRRERLADQRAQQNLRLSAGDPTRSLSADPLDSTSLSATLADASRGEDNLKYFVAAQVAPETGLELDDEALRELVAVQLTSAANLLEL